MSADYAIRLNMGLKDWALLLCLSTFWGASFVFMEIALRDLPVLTIVAARVALAAIALNVFIAIKGIRLSFPAYVWRGFAVMALLGQVLPFALIIWAQIEITAGASSILNATLPFFTVVLAHFLTADEKLRPRKILGLVAGFAGVVVIIGPQALAGLYDHILAQCAVLLAALLYALAIIYARRFRRWHIPSLAVATGQLTCSTLLLLPFVVFIDTPWLLPMPSPDTWLAMAGMSLVSTALAFIIYYHLISTVGATNVSLVTFLMPVSTVWLAAVILAETLTANQLAGMGLIGLGLLVMNGFLSNALKKLKF
jgi:drug/metabolite transporter (DMT)-like permease